MYPITEHVNLLLEKQEEEKNKDVSVFQQLEMSKFYIFTKSEKLFEQIYIKLRKFNSEAISSE